MLPPVAYALQGDLAVDLRGVGEAELARNGVVCWAPLCFAGSLAMKMVNPWRVLASELNRQLDPGTKCEPERCSTTFHKLFELERKHR